MKHYRISYDTYVTVTKEADPDDDWSRDSTDTLVTNIRLEEVQFPEREYFDVAVEDGEGPLYLLYALYTTGDSFGEDSGNFEAILLHRDRWVAEDNKRRIWDHYENLKDGYSVKLMTDDGTEFLVQAPWIGFFESLDTVEIKEFENV